MRKTSTQQLVLAGLFVGLGLIMPFVTGQIPAIGRQLLPMHIPILLGGFVLGGPLALAAGLVTPLLRSVLFGAPPLFPSAVAMSFELAAYGFLAAFFYRRLPRGFKFIYLSLLLAMLGGRAVWGAVSYLLYGLAGQKFTFQIFLGGAVLNALPGIVIQLLFLPSIVVALQMAGFLKAEEKQ